MLDFETSMRIGAERYRPVTEALTAAGFPATFTQTGGMNLAIEVTLEGGHYVLVTDVEDCLSWHPQDNHGWGVAFYPDPERPELGDGPTVFAEGQGHGLEALLELVRSVVQSGSRRLALDGIRRTAERRADLPGADRRARASTPVRREGHGRRK